MTGAKTSVSNSGRCLCGAVRFEFTGALRSRLHCHCESCRRATNSPFTTFFTVETKDMRWTGAEPKFYTSSPGVTRSFCGTCGSPMSYATDRKPGEIDFYAASLDDHSGFEPMHHFFWSEHVPWVELGDRLERKR